ncbi:MAG: thioredoxin domain-containing protein [Gemmatimonadetes bacterium]|nr:thioredoxin domain-containing protein [Gemmatimonadota bacterium]
MQPRYRTTFRLTLASLALIVTGCAGDDRTAASRQRGLSVADSVRARRNARLALRPDTMGNRVDSLRIAGSPGAGVYIVVVSDFQCPECRAFARDVLPVLRDEYVATGLARLAFINAPQDDHFNARFAAHAALCAASSNQFWAMHDTLFATQGQWARREDPRPWFDSMAVAVGADAAAQSRCTERQPLLHLMAQDMERSAAAGVREVPTVIIGEKRLSGTSLTLPQLRRAIDAARR